jgi:hypothetical protein
MKRLLIALLVVVSASGAFASQVHAGGGNGAPSGAHFELNIHGTTGNVSNPGGNNGHDIFLPLVSAPNNDASGAICDILLQQGPVVSNSVPWVDNFQVVYPTCNNPGATAAGYPSQYATNAVFELPCPITTGTNTTCPAQTSGSYTTTYTVWARQVGHFGSATMTTCFTDTLNATYCSFGSVTFTKKVFQNVTQQLLFVCLPNTTGGFTNTPIFANSAYQYFWDYDNAGLRLAQLRFYQQSNNVPVNTTACPNSGK